MKKRILTIILSITSVLVFSQNMEVNYPKFIGQYLIMIENNSQWKILKEANGDLNNDGLEDLTLILESKNSILEKRCLNCKIFKTKPRIILVFLNDGENQKTIIQNNTFIARGDEGGMLINIEPELSIKNGMLKIYYQYVRSNQSYTFEFINNQMKLVGAESNGVHSVSGDFESKKFDFIQQEIITTTGNISREGDKTEILKIDVKLKSLSEFDEMYEWEVTENKYL